MKTHILPAITLITFITIAVFGVLAMSEDATGSMDGCLAAMTTRSPICPLENPLNHTSFHLDAFISFSTATLESFSLHVTTMAYIMLMLWLLFLVLIPKALPVVLFHASPHEHQPTTSYFSFRTGLQRWLVQHEMRHDAAHH